MWVLAVVAFGVAIGAASASAQPAPGTGRIVVGSTFSGDLLRDLPLANLFAVVETIQPEVVTDRFNSGGLNGGTATNVVALLGSSRQTRYLIGDIDIGSADDGTPLLFPEIALWRHVDVATAMMPAELNANGLAISVDPVRPAVSWTGMAEAFASGGTLVAQPPAAEPPPGVRLDRWRHVFAIGSGPIGRTAGLVLAAGMSDTRKFDRAATELSRERASSFFAHLVLRPVSRHEFRTVAWLQHSTNAPAMHLQSTVETIGRDTRAWRIYGGLSRRGEKRRRGSRAAVFDRLVDGPASEWLPNVDTTQRRWTIGGKTSLAVRRSAAVGVEYAAASVRSAPMPDVTVGETIDGIAARVWSFTNPTSHSRRSATTVSGYARDRFALSDRVLLDAALRFESAHGRAGGAVHAIRWNSLLPNIAVQWRIGHRFFSRLFTGYRRSANQLTLDLLAYGDPAAPVARVYRWEGGPTDDTGVLVARVGPGTGGDSAFSAIDPQLNRPHADEFVIGIDSHPTPAWQMRVAGIARRQSSLVNVVNVGVPLTSYRAFSIPDANADLIGPSDDQFLTVYERLPQSFGQDRYLLTNTNDQDATMGAVMISAQVKTERLFTTIGATAFAVVGAGTSRGFRVFENDHDALGELFVTPNAATNARGRLFSDRAYVIKWATVYRFPLDLRVGVIARYQDGQPFSRLVLVPNLEQGAEVIQAFARGRSRFAFTGTLDLRVTKGVSLGGMQLEFLVDLYNVPNMAKEVEEYVVTGVRFRETTAIQPPRAMHVGLRTRF